MSTHKHIDLICVVVLVCTVLITVLFMNGERCGLSPVIDWDAENSTESPWFTRNDRDGDWDASGATRVVLKGDTAAVHGGGAYAYDGDVVIAQAGRYVLSGALTDGSVIVSANSTSKVWLKLDGVDITCSDDACIRVDQADKVFLTLAEGSENSLASGAEYSEAAVADRRGGVVFSHDDLTVNGSGSLRVTAGYKHGFDVNDELVITGGAITIKAPQDGLHANDGLRIESAELAVRAGDEGISLQGPEALLVISSGSFDIHSTAAGVKSAGGLLVEDGALTVESETDAVQCAGSAELAKASFRLNAGDEGLHLLNADSLLTIRSGNFDIHSGGAGIKCAGDLRIEGGALTVESETDAVQCEGSAELAKALYKLNAGDEGLHLLNADSLLTIHSGSFDIHSGGAGIKCAGDLRIEGGALTVKSETDAIRCEGGAELAKASFRLDAGDEGIRLLNTDSLLAVHSGSFDIHSGGAGVKCEGALLVEGGTFGINSVGDAIHCAGAVTVEDGAFTISSDDDGVHSDVSVTIRGGSLHIDKCYEGVEAKTIEIAGGEIVIYPTDDGLNANGGSFGFGPPGMMTGREASTDGAADEDCWIRVSGGSLTVVNENARDADGLDSNGDIFISGGVIRVSLNGDGSNNAIDYGSESGGVCEISGGEIVACGGSVMAEAVSESSTQCSAMYNLSAAAPAGTCVRLLDRNRQELLNYTAPCSFTSVILSSPGMKRGESCIVVIDDQEKLIILNNVSDTYGEKKGGNMGWGGLRGRGGRPDSADAPPQMNGERPERPDMPAPPDMNGEPPDFADMGPPPDTDGAPPEPGDKPEAVQTSEPGSTPAPTETPEPAPTDETAPVGPRTVDRTTWIMVGVCLFVLLTGILFAVKYRI